MTIREPKASNATIDELKPLPKPRDEYMSPAMFDVIAERQRHTTQEGWTHQHDEEHAVGTLSMAAASYAIADDLPTRAEQIWPWNMKWWKPTDRRRNLVKAGALIIAEIERMDRVRMGKR